MGTAGGMERELGTGIYPCTRWSIYIWVNVHPRKANFSSLFPSNFIELKFDIQSVMFENVAAE